MRAIFRLAVAEWFASKVWVIFLVLFIACVGIAPLMVASELDPSLAAPAINQLIYGLVFILCAFHGPMFAAEIGRAQVARSHRIFWRAQGVRDVRYYVALMSAAIVPILFICFAGFAFMRMFGAKELTTLSLFQAMLLTGFAFVVPIPLAVGISQKGGASFAFAITVLAEVAGFYGPAMLDFIRQKPGLSEGGRIGSEVLLTIIPQLRIGDQAQRVTFAWDALHAPEFFGAAGYLLLCLAATGAIGLALFQRKRT